MVKGSEAKNGVSVDIPREPKVLGKKISLIRSGKCRFGGKKPIAVVFFFLIFHAFVSKFAGNLQH